MWSTLYKKEFDETDSVRIINPKQAAFYWSKGIQPLTIYPSRDYTTDEPILAFVFKRSETKELYTEWCGRKKIVEKEN